MWHSRWPIRVKGRKLATKSRHLVIVESPAKAKTIQGYLGSEYRVEASVGHIRDLPSSASEVPAAIKGEPWGRMAIDVEHGFEPYYVVPPKKKPLVTALKKALAEADELILATDEDREGEAIAWHLTKVLKPKVPVARMVFHEITKEAIQHAAANTRELNSDLVNAQEARRLIDRLYGFEISPVLWKKVLAGLSAGRVQSVATRLVVARERARIAFRSAEYWDIEGRFAATADEFPATLAKVAGADVARGSDFTENGILKAGSTAIVLDSAAAHALAAGLAGAVFTVAAVEDKPRTRTPSAPFMTSTLQQEASRKLRWGAQRTMRAAQSLYENGHITYMRTDSTSLSTTALAAARSAATALYGADYASPTPRTYDRKVKNAQEAHEAIRPAGDQFARPVDLRGQLSTDEYALYELIWRRTVASQMRDAKLTTTSVRLSATADDGRAVEFRASGTVVVFPGFLAAYEEGRDEVREGEGTNGAERKLPLLRVGDLVSVRELRPAGHSTNPPARYTEASLVKELEERGIGRPSTYAAIIATIIDRGYVSKRGSALVPSFLAFSVTRLMEDRFAQLVDYNFTARLEEILDQVANATVERLSVLEGFFYGNEAFQFPGLRPLLTQMADIDARALASFPVTEQGISEEPVTGGADEIVLRVGKFGPYLERDGQRANVPAEMAPDELDLGKADELLSMPQSDRVLGAHPESGLQIVAKSGRFGPYVTEVLPPDAPKSAKPRTGSLLSGMSVDTVELADALKIFSLPRVVGLDPDGNEITAANGRYGPYVSRTVDGKSDSRSLPDEESLFTVTVPDALELFAAPRTRRGQARVAAPLRELGTDPTSGEPITLREGRFGPYVTDGTTNASLRRGDDPATLTQERAVELIADRRAAGPAKKRPTTKAGATKAGAGTKASAGAKTLAGAKKGAGKSSAKAATSR